MTEEAPKPQEQSELEAAIEKTKAELAEKSNKEFTGEVAGEFAKVSKENETLKAQMEEMNKKLEALTPREIKEDDSIPTEKEASKEIDNQIESDELKKKLSDMQEQLDQVKTRKSMPNLPQNQTPTQTPLEQGRADFKKDGNAFLKKDMEERFGINL